jgi:hypothetical protein
MKVFVGDLIFVHSGGAPRARGKSDLVYALQCWPESDSTPSAGLMLATAS